MFEMLPSDETERVRKVAAILTRTNEEGLEGLVFDHPLEEGGFMVQLPAGTVEPGEPPEDAVVRELQEETGVVGALVDLAAVLDEEINGAKYRRWVYVLSAPEDVPDEWPFQCDCGVPTVCHWLPLDQAEIVHLQQPWLNLAREWIANSARLGGM